MTQGELFKYGIKPDDKYCFCGEKDSIDHTLIHCCFTKSFVQKVRLWFNKTNNSQISPTTEELLFGITTNSPGNNVIKQFNYTTLFKRYYIYTSKLHNKPIFLHNFIDAYNKGTYSKIPPIKQERRSAPSLFIISSFFQNINKL